MALVSSSVARPVAPDVGTSGISAVRALLRDSQVLGDSLALTSTHANAYGSMFQGDADLAANELDSRTIGGIALVSAMAGATLLAPQDMAGWTAANISADTSDCITTLTEDTATSTHRLTYGLTVADAAPITLHCRVKPNGRSAVVVQFRTKSGAFPLVTVDLTASGTASNGDLTASWTVCPDGWVIVDATLASIGSGATSPEARFGLSTGTATYEGDGVSGVLVTCCSMANLAAPSRPFPSASAIGTVINADILTCTPTFGASGWMAGTAIAYGWDSGSHPVSANSVLLSDETFKVVIGGANPVLGAITSTKTISSLVPFFWYCQWNGTNIGLQIDDETLQTALSAAAPAGTMRLGNEAGGAVAGHVIMSCTVGSGNLSAAQIAQQKAYHDNIGSIAVGMLR